MFGLRSNDPPDAQFTAVLADVFASARAEVVQFDTPLQRRTSTNTIYPARTVNRIGGPRCLVGQATSSAQRAGHAGSCARLARATVIELQF